MLIRLGYELIFDVPAPTVMLLLLHVHHTRRKDVRTETGIRVSSEAPLENFIDAFGNSMCRLVAAPGELRLTYDAVIEDSGLPDEINLSAVQHPVQDLPYEALPYLLNSRYCEVDLLNDEAWKLFGNIVGGWARVQAICDWCHDNVKFGYEFARPTKTAAQVYQERQGVCRDFTHLAVTFCRCLNIPARYVTGYLGDIGVPEVDLPMDFSAWFEVYLSGRWWTFDARHNTPRIGRVLMAQGRDATDVAITTSFGATNLRKFLVWTDEVNSATLPQML
jgi:transglutaminase-like putative cysteine protease